MKKSKKVAFCSLIVALSCAVMLATRLFTTLSYACGAIAGLFIITIVLEYGNKWALVSYFAAAILSVLFASADAAIVYVLLFGYYPILKGLIEGKISSYPLQWGIKVVYFNIVMVACYYLIVAIVGPFDDLDMLGKFALPIMALICNAAFIIYDVGTTKIISGYNYLLRPRIHKIMK